MAKHGNVYFLQLSRLIFNDEPYKSLSVNAKWLYVVLKELEQRYTGTNQDYFWRMNRDLAEDTGFSERTLDRAKAELLKTDLVKSWQAHFILDKGTSKERLSTKHITCYRVLRKEL